MLRDADDELGLAPAPGLADLDALVEEFRAAGLRVDLGVDGELAGLPAGVDMSAYRIVQEALTNALRYAAGRSSSCTCAGSDGGVRITAANPVAADGLARQRPRPGRA